MNSNVKICAVPQCVNTSLNKPNKIFIHVPSNKTIRYKWLKLARRDPKSFKLSTNIYFCEDHFDLPNSMDNYMEYHVMGSVPQVRIKPGCIPTKFICQPDRRKRTSDDVTVRPFIIKKQRQTLIEEAIKDLEEQSTPTPLENEETTSVNPVVCEDIENNIHEHRTADKSIQVYITHKFRSKAIQTGIKFVSQMTSPIKTNIKSVNTSPIKISSCTTKVKPITSNRNLFPKEDLSDQNTPNQEPPVTALEISVQIKEEQVSESERTAEGVVQSEPEANGDEITGKPSEEWLDREQALLKRIEELEQIKTERSEDGLRLELKVREEEIDLLRSRVKNLETELQAALSKPAGKNQEIIQNIKQQHEELLSKARGMIFDKTKMVKNQELQIEALNNQVQSLKDINTITKDLLNIRNSEVKAMEDRLEAMEARYKAEKERHNLVLQRAQTSSGLNDDLKKEYETQLAIFKELRVKYEQRVQALVSENQQLKDLRKMTAASPNP